jgi:GTP cyclohydrolase II
MIPKALMSHQLHRMTMVANYHYYCFHCQNFQRKNRWMIRNHWSRFGMGNLILKNLMIPRIRRMKSRNHSQWNAKKASLMSRLNFLQSYHYSQKSCHQMCAARNFQMNHY